MTRVRSHKSKRGSMTVNVSEHNRSAKYRTVNSSFIDAITEAEGGGYHVIIKGSSFYYPELPNSRVSSLIKLGGNYYNKSIRGKFF